MGNSLGSKQSSKNSTKHGNCQCTLYYKYNHCCSQRCFGAIKKKKNTRNKEKITRKTEKALLSALRKYKAEYLISTIMEYLVAVYNLVEITSNISAPGYLSYSYEPLKSLINDTNTPCDPWIESIKTRPNWSTVPVAEIKVYKSIYCIPYILYCISMYITHYIQQMVMLGSAGVGKSALTIRYITDNFLDEYDPTVEDSYSKQIEVNGKTFVLNILDTASREEFVALQDHWIREGTVIFICFSITNRYSWEDAALYRRRLVMTKGRDDTNWAAVLIATKCDLEEYRKVSKKEILEKANEWSIPVIETSAKTKKNVEHVFVQGLYAYWVNSQTKCVNLDMHQAMLCM